jgi:acyl-CoA synthetase (AMP-forming)/AMP-acid ligase II
VAFVVPVAGAVDDEAVWLAGLNLYCAERLGRFKRPATIFVLQDLPRSPTGKLLRRKLREHLHPAAAG